MGEWFANRWQLHWHDLRAYVSDIVKFRRHSKYALARETTGELNHGSLGEKVAIVAIYPTSDIMFSIRNICTALSGNGYSILLVSSTVVEDHLRDELLNCCTLLFERYGFGRDFGSYAAAIHWLDKQGRLGTVSSLVLTNDSVFWPSDFSSEINSLDSVDADWKCLFEHLKVRRVTPHAQSFFLMFGPKVINSTAFRKYWQEYTPWSTREHAIFEGEIGFSRCLMKAGFRPHASYTFPRLWSELRARIDSGRVDLPLKLALFDMSDADLRQMSFTDVSLSEVGNTGQVGVRDKIALDAVRHVSHRFFEQSPSHGAGLLCNILLGAPLKRDLCSKYGMPIGLVLATAQNYDEEDMEHLHAALLAKGTRLQYNAFEQFLLDKGRL